MTSRTTHLDSSHISPPNIHNVSRVRADSWNRVRDLARRRRRGHELDQVGRQELEVQLESTFALLATFEPYFAFPGPRILDYLLDLFRNGDADTFAETCATVTRLRTTGAYRKIDLTALHAPDFLSLITRESVTEPAAVDRRPYFELLVIEDLSDTDEAQVDLRRQLHAFRNAADEFVYEVVIVRTLEDALLAVTANKDIQAVVPRFSFPLAAERATPGASANDSMLDAIYTILGEDRASLTKLMPGDRTARLGAMVKALRPEIDVYRITDAPIETAVAADHSNAFRRHFYQTEDYFDLHVSILKGVHDRYDTPFFGALRRFSEKPTGMFHALPVSRGRTIAKSHWIQDFGDFYGPQLFLAETSATTGGLDSLLQPTGSLKRAQDLAARAFGADRTFFVTNGTSTANKIVMQALVRPGDIVMLSHDCHKSHPYGVILAGAFPVYLDPYPLTEYSMYGGVSIETITNQLMALKAAGKLDRVRLLLLTNITFDGITYDPYRVMKAVLAIKPDIVFVWDEAWFAYGRFSAMLRHRTAIDAARRLDRELRSDVYRARFETAKTRALASDAAVSNGKSTGAGKSNGSSAAISMAKLPTNPVVGAQEPLPDPDLARVRVYATQSTHKTLTALRQGSMIHVHDTDFERGVEEVFHEAYMTHTSTSPNYQILASLDVGRRQVELEGAEMVGDAIELALTLRERIIEDPLLARWFQVLGPKDMVPAAHRPSQIERYWNVAHGIGAIEKAWREDEFVLDPTRITLGVGRTGMDGDTFKTLLMDRYDIHINKTSRNSVLFLIHIGMSRGTIAHLVKVLRDIAHERERWFEHASTAERTAAQARVHSLQNDLPPLPNFSRFHGTFVPDGHSTTPEGDMRRAFFMAYEGSACEFIPFDAGLLERVSRGPALVSASFLTPYPPGFPVLVPGQVLSSEIVRFLLALDVKEIHGLDDLGIRVFKASSLDAELPSPSSKHQPVGEAQPASPTAPTAPRGTP